MQPKASSRRSLTSQHLLIYQLYRHGEAVYDGLDSFRVWLERPNAALSNKRPIDQLTTAAGFKEVDDLITRIEFGVY